MARAPDRSSAEQFNVTEYTQSWAANNPFYAAHVNWAYDATGRTGYSNVKPQDRGISATDPMNWASPTRKGTAYDRFGNVNKQRGDVNLGLVLMGGTQFPGQAFIPERSKLGTFTANRLARWMNEQGVRGYSPEGRRSRNYRRETGWSTMLSQSISSSKGVGQSSEDTTEEMYSTQETRLGTRAYFTDEEVDANTGKMGRTWAGFKPLSTHAMNPHFDSKLGQMFKTESPNVGFARRTLRSSL